MQCMHEGPLRTNVKSVKTSILVLKVIQGHCCRYQSKPVYDFLLVINCNLGAISHRFRDMANFRLKSLPRGRYSRSRSSKVIDLGLNGKPIGDFLLVINCNLGPISHRFARYGQLLVQNRKIFLPPSHLGPSIGVSPMDFLEKRYRS